MKTLDAIFRDFDNDASTLSHKEIIELRDGLKALGDDRYLLRSLWYDYDKQCWIDAEQ